VGILMNYGQDGRGVFPGRGNIFVSAPKRPGRLLSHTGYRSPYLRGESGRGTNLTANLHLLPRTNGEAIPPTLTGLHGVVLIT
jgi:hypothetical protein